MTILGNELILRAIGNWWDPNEEGLCVWAAHQPKGAESFAASLVDLSENGHNATDPGGAATPGWTQANGWQFDGAATYLATSWTVQLDQSQSAIVRYSGAVADSGMVVGLIGTGVELFIEPIHVGGVLTYTANGWGGLAIASPQAAGILAVAGNLAYRNGIQVPGTMPAGGTPSAATIAIGAIQNDPFPIRTGFYTGYIQAAAYYDCTLTGPQVLAISTAMAAL